MDIQTLLFHLILSLTSAIGVAYFVTSEHDIAVYLKHKALFTTLSTAINGARSQRLASILAKIYLIIKSLLECTYCLSFWVSLLVLVILGNYFAVTLALFNAVVSYYSIESLRAQP